MTPTERESGSEPPSHAMAHRPLGTLIENVGESATACLVTMVQGNVFALTLGHWLIASRTGLLSGTVATAAVLLAGKRGRTATAFALALATIVADYFSHPSHFLGPIAEACFTGFVAGALSYVIGKVIEIRRALRQMAR